MDEWRKEADLTPGVLVQESHYYQLAARDVEGNVWMHPSIDLTIIDEPEIQVLSFSCDRIQAKSSEENRKSFAYFMFLDELQFPENRTKRTKVESGNRTVKKFTRLDGSNGLVAGIDVTYEKRKNEPGERYSEFVAVVPEDVKIGAYFSNRMLESIRFCTATMVSPIMSVTVVDDMKTIELAKCRSLNSSGLIHAPISTSRANSAGDFFKLFECYYLYACANGKEKEFSSLSSKLGGLFALKGVWIDIVALLLGVAVEGVLKEDKFKDIVKSESSLLKEIAKLTEYIQSAPVDAALVNRAVNAVKGMSSPTSADKLNSLIKAGALEEEDRIAWKRI